MVETFWFKVKVKFLTGEITKSGKEKTATEEFIVKDSGCKEAETKQLKWLRDMGEVRDHSITSVTLTKILGAIE
jgi:hypothetical protein